ncbi:MAG: Flp pilus assembly complex ATPase component TadA [Planctomycetes bacterium]|nr:Flp pilus assembly complex ATPase component TadA [Planctomycetota bacterium]
MTDTTPTTDTAPTGGFPQDRIRESLLKRAGLDDAQIREALQEEREGELQLDQVLIQKGFLQERPCLELFGDLLGLDYVDSLDGVHVPDAFIQDVPVQFARTHALIAIGEDEDVVRVVTHRPLDVQPMDDLATMMGREVEAVLAPRKEINNLINRAYRHKADGVDEALQDVKDTDIVSIAENIEESEDLLDANKAPVIKLVNMLLFQALKLRASDIHLQPYGDRLQVRMRIDGVLYDMESIPRRAQEAIVSRVKVMGKMDIAERRLPQDGRASIRIGDGDVDVRISTVPVAGGERIVFRILDKTTKVYALDDIGLEEEAERTIRRYINYSHGVIFVTGPTGSGKTTTLYACLDAINAPELNILTIEDPVEYNLDGISQVQVNTKKGLTFASGLRSFLRQDPDVMMVGEVRDSETADIAIRAALTGHLVFSTVHTNDSASTVTRLIDIGVEPSLVSSSLLCVIAQRLLRTLCPNCKEPVTPNEQQRFYLEDLQLTPDQFPDGKLWIGRGCDECFRSGFAGRTAIYEVMPIDVHVQEQIINKATASEIKRGALERGLRTLRMDGIQKLMSGMTTPEEVLRVTQLDVS